MVIMGELLHLLQIAVTTPGASERNQWHRRPRPWSPIATVAPLEKNPIAAHLNAHKMLKRQSKQPPTVRSQLSSLNPSWVSADLSPRLKNIFTKSQRLFTSTVESTSVMKFKLVPAEVETNF